MKFLCKLDSNCVSVGTYKKTAPYITLCDPYENETQ